MNLSFTGPLLVFGGPYSNLEALKAMHQVARKEGIEPDHCVCTGDVVAYCADAAETVSYIRDWGCHVVMGNCEEALAQSAPDCGCGFEEGTACDSMSKQWFSYAQSQITQEMRDWMGTLPRQIEGDLGKYKLQFVHGGIDQINRFIFASQLDLITKELSKTNSDIVIAGHSGLPFSQKVQNKLWLNPGVIGMPANDGGEETWFAILNLKEFGLEINFHKLVYDVDTARDKMIRAGLNNGYAKALKTGFWPSQDILPDEEKCRSGCAANPENFLYSAA